MARFDYKVTTKNNKVFTRSSNRVYPFAVVFVAKDGTELEPEYCGRMDLADKKSIPSWRQDIVKKDIYQVEVIKDRGPK